MSDSDDSPVVMFENTDPNMQAAFQRARETFRYFWREVSWESRRIVPGLDMAFVKMPFDDGDAADPDSPNPDVEHMWVNQIRFDGKLIHGVLGNSPNWLTTVKEGDEVSRPVDEISDWMYAIRGRVYGAHTVNVMRAGMSARERKQHDDAWGLDFGDPENVLLAPVEGGSDSGKPGCLGMLFGKKASPPALSGSSEPPVEHPMSDNMVPAWRTNLQQNTDVLTMADDDGWNYLHVLALAGATGPVALLLEFGGDPNVRTPDGRTPLDMAESLNWTATIAVLKEAGGTNG